MYTRNIVISFLVSLSSLRTQISRITKNSVLLQSTGSTFEKRNFTATPTHLERQFSIPISKVRACSE